MDAAQFMLERQKCRRERVEQQRRINRKRGERRVSIPCIGIEESGGSNRDHSPDGRSQTSSMSEKSGQTTQRRRQSHSSRGTSSERTMKSSSTHHRRDSGHRKEGGKDHPKERQHNNDRQTKEQPHRRDSQRSHHKDAQHGRDPRQRHSQSMGHDSKHSGTRPRSSSTPHRNERRHAPGHSDQAESSQSPSLENSPKAGNKRKSHRPSVDASCQVSEGDAPLAVIQRAAMKVSGATASNLTGRAFCKKHDGELLVGANLVFPGSLLTGSIQGAPRKAEQLGGVFNVSRKEVTDSHSSESRAAAVLFRAEVSEAPSSYKRSDLSIDEDSRVRRITRQDTIRCYGSGGSLLSDDAPCISGMNFKYGSSSHTRGLMVPPPPASPPPGSGSLLAEPCPIVRKTSTGSEGHTSNDLKPPYQCERRVSDHVLEQRRKTSQFHEHGNRGSSLDSVATVAGEWDAHLMTGPRRLQRSERLMSAGQLTTLPWHQMGTCARPAFRMYTLTV